MKRTSTHLTRTSLPQPAPPPAPVEPLRFRERDGTPSAYTRLYAQGVDQLVHKDHVYQQFGLHKSPPAPALQAARNKTLESAVMAAATPLTNTPQPCRSSVLTTKAAPTALRHRSSIARSSSTSTRAVTPRCGGSTMSSSTTKRTVAGAGTNRTRATTTATAPSVRTNTTRTNTTKPQRRQSAIATQLLNKTLKIGPALIHSVSSAAMLPPSHAGGSLQRRPSTVGSPTSYSQHHQQTQLHRRPSFQVAAPPTARSLGKVSSPGRASDSAPLLQTTAPPPPHPAVLVPVSRRTSSSLVAPNMTDFGMRRRPSVSPIRGGTNQPSNTTSTTIEASGGGPRPSIMLFRRDSKMDRLVEQITVLKNSLGLSDEDLQWKVESTKGNAFEAADRHVSDAEEHYDRLVYEIQLLSETPCDEASTALVKRLRELVKQTHRVAALKPTLASCQADALQRKKELLDARIASELQVAKGGSTTQEKDHANDALLAASQQHLDDTKQRILQLQNQLTDEMTTLNDLLTTLGTETETLATACARFKFLSPDAADASASFLNILRCIPECAGEKLLTLCEQGVATAQRFTGSKATELKRKEAESEKLLRDIEVWKLRRDQSKEFAFETAKRERHWKLAQHDANTASLRLLRTLVPLDIQQITVDALIERAYETGGVLFTYDLALYIKQNRLLHWLVTHESDIARDNFLGVENAPSFVNFTAYDIYELRAVCGMLPEAFDFDKDGKKAEWKRQFMDHVRLLVQQQGGETIKAGWDPIRGARADVPLKPLSEKQLLNAVYRYPTEEEIQLRIDKFELQLQRLKQKKEKKEQLESQDIPTAKSEYLAIAEDARSDELQQQFGKATLIKLRDEAKQSVQALTKTRDALKSEIDHVERQWNAQTPSYEQFLTEVAKIRALDAETRGARIKGPFPAELELKPRARATFKKLSVEEEAEARRMELSQAIADRDKGLVDESVNNVPEPVTTSGSNVHARMAAVVAVSAVGTAAEEEASPRESTAEPSSDTPSPAAADGAEMATVVSPSVADESVVSTPSTEASAFSEETAGVRRIKSLRVAPEVLRFLQNDFCSPRRTKSNTTLPISEILGTIGVNTSTPSAKDPLTKPLLHWRRPSLPKAGPEPAEADAEDTTGKTPRASVAPALPAKPKSKALLALLANQAQSSSAATATSEMPTSIKPVGMKLDFLSELKLKRNAGGGDAGDVLLQPPLQRPAIAKASGQLDLFSELKSRTNKSSSTTTIDEAAEEKEAPPKKMSFLEELASRAKRTASISPATADCAVPSPPLPLPPPIAAAPTVARNFLDELKANARKKMASS